MRLGIIKKVWATLLLLMALVVIAYDTRIHFDDQRVDLKISHKSAQRHWSIYYSQQQVFNHSSFRYDNDLRELKKLITANSIVMSDLASSYYLAAELPIYVENIHRHHGRDTGMLRLLQTARRNACYLYKPESKQAFIGAVRRYKNRIKPTYLEFKYLLLNKDSLNRNLRDDCLARRIAAFEPSLAELADLQYEGEYLNLYRIRKSL